MENSALRERTESLLAKHGVPVPRNLPEIKERVSRSSRDVAQRVVIQYCLAGLAHGADSQQMLDWLSNEGLAHVLEDEDRRLLATPLDGSELNAVSWQQESLGALCWAMRRLDRLAWPDVEVRLESVFALIPPEQPVAEFLAAATLREGAEIIAAADLYYCLDAAMRDDSLWGGQPVDERYPTVQIVMERRWALDWLLSSEPWWDITLDT